MQWPASVAVLTAFLIPCLASAGEPKYAWKHEEGKSLTFLVDGTTLWTLHYDKAEGKPYFHPVCLPDGTVLTWHRPPDHRWHRALWFSWKYINKLNYWEENKQGVSQGSTEVVKFRFEKGSDGVTGIRMDLEYRSPGQLPVLTEHRRINIGPPAADGSYTMTWVHLFQAGDQPVTLDRTPIKGEQGGKSWGGYAGLSFRATKAMTQYQVVDSAGRRDMGAHGKPSRWIDLSGVVGPKGTPAGVTFLNHPSCHAHPTPGYVIMRGHFGYVSPALLFHKAHHLPARKPLPLLYQVLIHPGRPDAVRLDKMYKELESVNF